MSKYVIIGNGIAGISAVRKIRSIDKLGSITLLSQEPYPFYYRPRLPEIISGEVTLEEITIHKPAWYESNKINAKYTTSVDDVDTSRKLVITSDRQELAYDKLLLASGGIPFVPPIPGADKKGVHTFRTADDALRLLNSLRGIKSVTIIGGGLLALEVGFNLTKLGITVHIIEMIDRLLPRQLDYEAAGILQKALEEKGFVFHLAEQVDKIDGAASAERVLLKSGKSIPAEAVILCIGVRSKLDLAKKTGVAIEKAVVADDQMRTSINDIWTAGDVAEHKGIVWGLWNIGQQQGTVAGANMAGASMQYQPQPNTTSLKVTGIDLISSGIIDDKNYDKTAYRKDKTYRKLVLDNGKIVGCILLGEVTNDKQILKCMSDGININAYKSEILDPDFRDWDFLERKSAP